MKNSFFHRFCVVLFVLATYLNPMYAERVSLEDAATVASNFMNASASSASGSQSAKRMVLKKSTAANRPQFYIYENADGEGWVMVAANDIARPIIAYSDEGQFRTDNQPENLKHWLGSYEKQIRLAEQNGLEATEDVKNEWKQLRKGVSRAKAAAIVAPLIKTGWDQDSPYWNLCPSKNGSRCYTGCVATAMAQVMNYHQWPEKGTGSHSITYNGTTYTANFGTTTYDWANMKNSYSGSSTTAQKTAVATLMYHCGVAVDMSYGTNSEGGSGAFTIDYNGYFSGRGTMCAETALPTFFGYKSSTIKGYFRDGDSSTGMKKWTESEWIKMLKDELDASRPIMYAGGDSEGETGHSFVCDGYDSDNKFHFNWGWGNYCDGYYNVNSLVPSSTGSGGGNGDYSYDQDVIVGIIPDKKDLPKYNVTWSVKGSTTSVEYTEGDALVLPSAPADCSGSNGKKFVGWTANSSVNGSAPSDLFTSASGKTVTGDITYYAVFATATTSGGGGATTWTKVTDASTLAVGDVLVIASDAEGKTATDISSQVMGEVATTFSNGTITSLGSGTIELTLGGSSGAWTLTSTNGALGATAAKKLAWANGTTTWSISISNGNATIQNGTSSYGRFLHNVNSTRFTTYSSATSASMLLPQLYRKSGGGGTTTYSAYSLTCDPPCANTPTMSFATEEMTKVTTEAAFTQAVMISGKGSGQTVAYSSSDESIATVNSSGKVTLQGKAGEVTITASVAENGTYCAAEAFYNITVTEPPINVTLYYNGTSATLNNQPNPYTLPTDAPYNTAMCDGDWTFAGWYNGSYAKSTTEPAYINQLTATGSANAVYKTTETSGSSTNGSKTFTFATIASNEGWANGVAQTEVSISPVTITASGGVNDGKYYTSDNTWRMYSGGTVTISVASGEVTSVTSNPSKTFTINNGIATLACTETIKFTEIAVAYTVSGSSTTYYATTPVCAVPCTNTPTMSFANTSVNKTTSDGSYTQTVSITGKGSGQTIAYSSSDETVATVNASGVVTLKGKIGSTTITASVAEDDTYCAASASYTITVTAAPIDVTLYYKGTSATLSNQTNPYTLPTTGAYVADMCSGEWKFDGWYGSSYSKSTTQPTYITELTSTGSAYAVYAHTETSGGGAEATAGTTMWSENWTGVDNNKTPTSPSSNGSTIYGSANITYSWTNGGSITQTYTSGGPNSNENILVSKSNGAFTAMGIPTGGATELTVTYLTSGSGSITVSSPTANVSVSNGTISISNSGVTEFSLEFKNTTGSNVRLDDILVSVKTAGSGGSSTTYYTTSPDCPTPCSNEITITKGANPAHGTFTLSNSGTICIDEGNASTTVTALPDTHYHLATVTSTSGTVGTIDGNTCTITGISANTTINVTFAADPKDVVYWYVAGTPASEEKYAGEPLAGVPAPTSSDCDGSKVFMGWTAISNYSGDAAPTDLFTDPTTQTMPAGGTSFYAVFATESTGGGSAALTKLGSESTFTEGDHIIIVAKGTTYALYQETVSTSYVKNWSFVNNVTTVGEDSKNYFTLSAGTDDWYLGDNTNGFLYNSGSANELYVKTDGNKAAWTIEWDAQEEAFTLSTGRYLSCRTDLTTVNANKYRGVSSLGTGTTYFDIYKYTIGGGTTYSEYTTSCVTYEVTAVPNNASYGTVAVDGYKITATPAEGYVADGYTVTLGTATVTQNGNLYSVVPTSDCKITINFRKATEYTVTFVDNNTSYTQTAYEGTPFELPEEGLSTCPDATFLGWVQGSYTDHATGTKTTPVYVSPGAETDITSATTFTAVYGITAPTDKYKALKAESELESGANYILAGYYSGTDYQMKGTMSSERIDAVSGSLTIGDEGNEVTDPLLVWRINILDKATKSISLYNAAAGKYLSIDAGNHIQLADEAFAFNYTTDDSGSPATWEFNSSGDAGYMLSFYSTYHQFNAYTSNSVNLYLYKQMIGMSLYTSHPECCYEPAEALTIESDVETIVGSGTAQLSLKGGNGRPVTWTTTDGTLSGQTNTAATLTLTTPGVYTVTATQEDDNTDADHVICGKEVSVTITVKAQWTITYKTIEEGIENTHNTAIVTDGASYTLPDISEEFTCPSGITFAGWASNKTATSVEQAAGTSQTASADATWYAVWTEGVSSGETVYLYEQVLSSSALAAGDKVIFVDKDKTVGLAEQADNNRRTGEVTANPDNADQLYFLSTSGVEELTVGKDGDYFTFQANDGYLYAASSSANHLKSQTTLSNNGKWTVSITDGAAALTAQGTNTRNQLRYNSSSHIFSCYSSGQQDITIWKKTTATKYVTTVSTGVSTTDNPCQSGAIIRAEAEQWITAAKGQKVKRVYEVKALGFDAATTLTVVGNTDPHFTATLGESSIPAAPGRLETTLTVEYLPTDADVTNSTAITLSAGGTTKTLTVNGRSLPDEFLVITKKTIWYALPANMNAGDKQYEGVVITPDDAEEPTSVAVAPSTIVYGLRSVDDSRYADNGTCVRLAGNGDKALWANTAAGAITIQNNEAVGSSNGEAYDWLLNTTDGIHYTIANPHHADYTNGRVLAFGDKFGQYKTETVFFLVPAECNSQPQEVNVSARRVDATFSWESNASSMAIDVYSDAEMTSLALSATATTVPHYMTGLTESTDYWFRLTPDGEAACAITGTFKTTGPTIDIAEWKEDAVVVAVDKDNDFHPSIVIDGEVEHGISGTVATEIFFSKYFEGAGDMKLVAIFNGTSNDISLADYSLYTKNCSAPKSNDDIASSSFGSTTDYPISALGTIKSGQEIVFFTRPGSGTLADCSDEFLDGMAAQSGADDNPRWIECNNSTLYGGQKFPLMQFNGNDAICLKKNDALVDVIGSTGEPGKEKNCANRLNDLGWSISVKNIDYGKATDDPSFNGLYEASSKEPTTETERKAILTAFNIDLDNEYIDLTTARCILFRDKRVLSGDSAVLMNTGAGFVTCTNHSEFRSEWNGRAVCMTKDMQTTAGVEDDSKATCNSYQDLGEFDYSNYYKDWESIDPGQELDQYIKDPETMTYEIPIANLAQYSCLNLRFQLKNDADEVVTEAPVQVPIIVKGGHWTIDAIFNEIVKTDGGDPLYEQSINRCKTCDVVVLSDGVLTKESDGSTHDVAEVGNVKVYPGGQLIVPAGTSYSVNSLAFRRQEDEIATADIQGNLGIKASGKNVFLDIRIDPTNWHYISLPYDCKVSDIRFANDELKVPVLGTDYLLKWYDGEKRAATQSGGCWEMVKPDAVLKRGIGYIFALPGDGKVKREFRFPMANDVIADEKNNKAVSGVYGFGCDKSDQELRPNDKGWNLIGAPYLMSYSSDITDPLRTGQLIRDPENPIYWTIDPSTTALRYIVEPVDNGWSEYRQVAIADYEMKPFTCYFVQIGGTDPAAEQGVAFNAAKVQRNSIVRRAPEEYEETEDTHPVWCAVSLTNAKGEMDETTMLISNDFTDGYDMMNDLVKMRGTYYKYAQITTRPVLASRNDEGEMAFNALPDASAESGIPLNYFAAQNGEYTIAYNDKYDYAQEVKAVMLLDKQTNEWTDLTAGDYTFSSNRTDNTDRFILTVRVKRKQTQTPTGFETPYDTQTTKKVLRNGHVYILRGGVLYDITGKKMLNY